MRIQDDPSWKCKHQGKKIRLERSWGDIIQCADCGEIVDAEDTHNLEDQFPGLIMQD